MPRSTVIPGRRRRAWAPGRATEHAWDVRHFATHEDAGTVMCVCAHPRGGANSPGTRPPGRRRSRSRSRVRRSGSCRGRAARMPLSTTRSVGGSRLRRRDSRRERGAGRAERAVREGHSRHYRLTRRPGSETFCHGLSTGVLDRLTGRPPSREQSNSQGVDPCHGAPAGAMLVAPFPPHRRTVRTDLVEREADEGQWGLHPPGGGRVGPRWIAARGRCAGPWPGGAGRETRHRRLRRVRTHPAAGRVARARPRQ